MPPVEEIVPAADLKQQPPKFVPSTDGLTPPMDDNAVRAIFADAAAKGVDDLNAMVSAGPVLGQPITPSAQVQPAPIEVPAKFQKPDGTVDEEKLKASSARLDEAIEEKQKTVEELLADYKAKEKEFTDQAMRARDLRTNMPNSPVQEQPMAPPPDMEATRQQLLSLQQQDPIAFAVEIARHVARKEASDIAAPALQATQGWAEQQRDNALRGNISKIAEQDPRILNPQIYAEFQKELNNPNENYFQLKNPHKAAWNEVRGRLRLGEATLPQAQPSNLGPILGRGTPTPVQGLGQPQSPQNLFQQATSVDPFSEEGRRLEAQLKQASEAIWRS